jgi:hypothetical protein
MIKLTSSIQAEQHKGQIPAIAALRMKQLEGTDGLYDPVAHGWLVVITEQDNVEHDFPELGEHGLLSGTDSWPLFDYVEKVPEGEGYVFEAVVHLDNECVRAYFLLDAVWLDPRLREALERAPDLKRG